MKRRFVPKAGLIFMISTVLVMTSILSAGADSLSPKISLGGNSGAPEIGIRVDQGTPVSFVRLRQ